MGTANWESMMSKNRGEDEDEGYPFPVVMKKRASSGSNLGSGQTTPGTTNGKSAGKQKILSEGDLLLANEALAGREFLHFYLSFTLLSSIPKDLSTDFSLTFLDGANGANGH